LPFDYDYVLHIVNFAILYVNNFDAPDAHFNHSSLFSDAQVEKVGNPEKKICENSKSHRMKTEESAMKLNQIRRRIELCLREMILRFEMNLQNLVFS
jgi:hypothetical protein